MFARYKRVLLKLSGDLLAGARESGIEPSAAEQLAREIGEVVDLGVEIGVVLGGGNIFRGESAAVNGMDRVTGDYIGMLATIMNGVALHDALEKQGCPARLQTAIFMDSVAEGYIRKKALQHLDKGRAVIFSGGTGNPFFTTDTAAALRAAEIKAEVILKGVPDTAGVVLDAAAQALCRENNIPVILFKYAPGSIMQLIRGANPGQPVEL
ncbi:MAG: uridine monophosphate kinase [Candidatus Margulisbacteria bacterium]|jgi:uridylate kinase|nr:uridine monophosphate kinase [Candidatus Margulisiibacteriota bacterium]